jgi:hypothetical protein
MAALLLEKNKKRASGHSCAMTVLPISSPQILMSPFRNYKPSESDLEDDDEEDDDDPSTWFHDDQDDGRKGQDIIEPDAEDMSDIIRVDTSRIYYNTMSET